MVAGRVRDRLRGIERSVRRVVGLPGRLSRRGAAAVAARGIVPDSAAAVLRYYAESGTFDHSSLLLQRRVEDRMDGFLASGFETVDRAVAAEFEVGPDEVGFEYETKLLMPATLTLGAQYRRVIDAAPDGFDPVERTVSPGLLGSIPVVGGSVTHASGTVDPEFSGLVREVDRIESMNRLGVLALLDGDMRDAINDDEYDDFEAGVVDSPADRERVARIAQRTLESRVEELFDRFPEGVREAYDEAVAVSESHQDRDPEFRELFERARADGDATDELRREYRDDGFDDPPGGFSEAELSLPYFATQYRRVGVIYDGMLDMYEAAGIPVDDGFRRAIVLAIIGAQVWLDDVDDYADDMREGQLTPVTAEYLLADSDPAAYRRVVELSEQYLDRAREHATESGATLAGIAVEYIRLSGDPSVLPGSDAAGEDVGSDDRGHLVGGE